MPAIIKTKAVNSRLDFGELTVALDDFNFVNFDIDAERQPKAIRI
jgi:hypothetical protein